MSKRGATPGTSSSGQKENPEKRSLAAGRDPAEGSTAASPSATTQDDRNVSPTLSLPHTSEGTPTSGDTLSHKTRTPRRSQRLADKKSPKLETSKTNPGPEAAKNVGSGGSSSSHSKRGSKQNAQPETEQEDEARAPGSSRPIFTLGASSSSSLNLVSFPNEHSASFVTRGGLSVSHLTGNEFVTVHSNFLKPLGSITQRRSWTDEEGQASGGSFSSLSGRPSPIQEASVTLEPAARSPEDIQLTFPAGEPNQTLLRRVIPYVRTVIQANCNKRVRNCLLALFGLTGGAVFLIDSYVTGTLATTLSEGVVMDAVEVMLALLGIIFGTYYFTCKEILPFIRRRRRRNYD